MNKKLYANITNLFAQKNNNDINELFQILLTVKERQDISLRLEILRRLHAGQTQRSIAEDLGIGIATVTRGSHQFQNLSQKTIQWFLEK